MNALLDLILKVILIVLLAFFVKWLNAVTGSPLGPDIGVFDAGVLLLVLWQIVLFVIALLGLVFPARK